MKRKNILKFVSLLGISSFVMLAAASCAKTTTNTPNPNPPSNGGSMTDDMSGGNTNPGGGEGMNNSDPELIAARTALTTLINSETQKTEKYVDYAKIKDTLVKAYDAAKDVLNNSASTTQNLNDAKTKLESAISTADKAKTDFDAKNTELVTAYNALKQTLKNKKTNLDSVTDPKYAAIRANFVSLYEKAKAIVTATLDPVTGNVPEVNNLKKINGDITNATERNDAWKKNADILVDSFIKQTLVKKDVTEADQNNNVQPINWSFAGYSTDLKIGNSGDSINLQNFNFAQRKVWGTNDRILPTKTAEGETQKAVPLTDVSWIYSLSGDQARNTLSFRYFGASPTVYLYFPYKLVKTGDNLGLQYKLNGATQPTEITFGEGDTINGETPTVDDIKIAKVTLSDLKFNLNTIEFSVPQGKIAPMIGNMYLTSNPANANKIYNSIFGNSVTTEENKTEISVDTLNGYSLAAHWTTLIYEYSGDNVTLDGQSLSGKKYYLLGWVGGTTGERGLHEIENNDNVKKFPSPTGDNRTYTLYVNAPKTGDYYIKGIFTINENRKIKFTNGSNHLTIMNLMSGQNMLKTFDTSATSEDGSNTEGGKKTLALTQGLNKIVVSGDGGFTPNFGHLTFALMNPSQM